MPERDHQLAERLEALVRYSAPGEFRNALHDHEPAKDPAAAVPANWREGRRRRNPRSGGVLYPRDSKTSWAVNIRPKNWGNKDKIWWGKIKSKEDAQRIADIVFHYTGSGPVHYLFPGAGEHPPPFLNDKLQLLDSVEKRLKYVKLIAKGEEHNGLRKELMESVKEMVKYLSASGHEEVQETLFTSTCNIRSPPELAVDRFDEFYGSRLSMVIPELSEDEIDLMMEMAAG